MSNFQVKSGRITFSIPSYIAIEDNKVELSRSDVRKIHLDSEGDPIAVELHFDEPSHGTVCLTIENDMYDRPDVFYGILNEPEDYEHDDDRPYDSLPRSQVPPEFIDGIIIHTDCDLE